MTYKHRSKLNNEEILDAFYENYEDVKQLAVVFDNYQHYLDMLRADVEETVSRVFGLDSAKKESLYELLVGWVDLQEEIYLKSRKKFFFILALMEEKKHPRKKKSNKTVSTSDIERARAFPIVELLEFNRANNALCLWHNDTNPSLHKYDNEAYCFVCEKHADTIEIYRKLYPSVSFVDAVISLSKNHGHTQ